jgi:DNA-binding transcriptional MocR family regulator
VEASRLARWLAPAVDARPLADGLAYALRSLIIDGRVVPGGRVPAERELAAALRVSRATVTIAYNRLRDEGFLKSRHGAGTVASIPAPRPARPDDDRVPFGSEVIDLTVAALPAPPELLQEAVAACSHDLPRFLSGAGVDPGGLAQLRSLIAKAYTRRGLPTASGQILITSGALHAWDLVLRCCLNRGGNVVIEQPTYPAILDAALAHRARVVPLPVDEGWDVGQVARWARPPSAVHVSFDGQNPTGSWADAETRRHVLARFSAPTVVVVDETMLEFRHTDLSTLIPPVSTTATIVHVGSMSKTYWAGLRVGWIRGPAPFIRSLIVGRAGQDLAPPILDQLASARLLERHNEIVPARRQAATRRRDALLDALRIEAPSWRADAPAAGLVVWIDLNGGSSSALARDALAAGLRVTPGTRFTIAGTHDAKLRLPLTLPEGKERDVIARLAALGAAPVERRRARRQDPQSAWAV